MYNPGVQDRSGEYIAQGITNLGNSIQQGMQSYAQNKTMAAQALGKFEGALKANPDLLQFLNPEEPSPNAPSDAVKAFMKLQKDGTVGVRDAALLSTFADTYTKAKEDKQQQEFRQMQMAQMAQQQARQQQEQAAEDQMNARMQQLAQLGRQQEQGVGGGVLRPEVSDRAKAFLQTGAGQLAAQGVNLNADQLVKLQLAQAAQSGKVDRPPQKYQSLGHVVAKDGTYLGASVLDQTTGETGLMNKGLIVPLPEGAEPITATGIQKNVPGSSEFRKLKADLTDAEISLRSMDRYMESVGDASVGLARMADKFSAGIKTLVGSKKLDTKEMAAKMAQGQLQGLLGSNRTNIVGGGVMTEQDALRIIQRLGGDFDALSNPEVVKAAIAQVYSDRFKQYDDDFSFYNAAVNSFYGSKSNGAFKNADRIPFSHNFGTEGKPAARPGATPDAAVMGAAASPSASNAPDFSKMSAAELQKRLDEIKGKK